MSLSLLDCVFFPLFFVISSDFLVVTFSDAEIQKTLHASFNASKAFYMYLGYPESSDALYTRWECKMGSWEREKGRERETEERGKYLRSKSRETSDGLCSFSIGFEACIHC